MKTWLDSSNVPPQPREGFDIGETEDSLPRMMQLFGKFGDLYRIYSPSRRNFAYVIHDPEHIQHVLVDNQRNYNKGIGLDRVKLLLGNGIMVSEGSEWKRRRRMVQPCFHARSLRSLFPSIRIANLRLARNWERAARSAAPVNVTEGLGEAILSIILEAIFGRDLQEMIRRHGANPFALVVEENERNLQFALRFRALRELVAEVVRKRAKGRRPCGDFLSILMQAQDDGGQGMTERELIEEVMTLIIAGHETTASALAWTWYLLSQHSEIWNALHDEVSQLEPEEMRDPSFLRRVEFTTQVIQESLRLYPPGWLLTRRAIGNDRIGDYHLPAGADVLISPYVVHRHPRYWEEPETFQPQRFRRESVQKRPRFCYIPFGAGPRQCAGEGLAMMEMQVHLALMARHFRLRYVGQQPVEMLPLVNLRMRRDLVMLPELVQPLEGANSCT